MYPGFAKTARDEGFEEIAEWLETLARAEKSHAGRFSAGPRVPRQLKLTTPLRGDGPGAGPRGRALIACSAPTREERP